MGLVKFLIYSIIAYFVIRLIRHLIEPGDRKQVRPRRSGRNIKSSSMVRCASCGTFIAEGSALALRGSLFCSQACAEARLRRTPLPR